MSFWFHFVGEKLFYRSCNFHDIIPSTLAVITNDMHSNSKFFVKIVKNFFTKFFVKIVKIFNQPYRDVMIKQSKNYFVKGLQLSSSFV